MKYIIKLIDPETKEIIKQKECDKLTKYSKEIDIPLHILRLNLKLSTENGDFDAIIKKNKSYKEFFEKIRIVNKPISIDFF